MKNDIFHIISRQSWSVAQQKGFYKPESIEKEGYIHCSRKEQVLESANRYFTGQAELLLLRIDPAKVKAIIHTEPGRVSYEQRFPHIYGSLNIDAVVCVYTLEPDADGIFRQFPKKSLSERKA